jgi:uroporphyrinogen-III synthase
LENKLKQVPFTKIFVTRPQKQNVKLQKQLLEYLGENGINVPVVSLPLIEIVPQVSPNHALTVQQALQQTDWVSFVSPNAFLMTYQLLKQYDLSWPTHLKIAVVGGGTESSILDSGIEFQEIVKPNDASSWDSEGLWQSLEKAQANWNGIKMVMIHGDGGRNFLAEKLALSGAVIQEFSVYRRECLSIHDLAWQQINPDEHSIWVFNSSQAADFLLQGLNQLAIAPGFLRNQMAIVSHSRILEKIQQIGFIDTKFIEPGDENLMKELSHIFETAL